jgi:Holliday junction resolvase RusA-like endonuclease
VDWNCLPSEDVKARSYYLEIPTIPPSLNELMGSNHMATWRKKQEWYSELDYFDSIKPDKPIEKAVVWLLYVFKSNRRRDADNLMKVVLDALVDRGWLADDSLDNVDVRVRKLGVDRLNPRTLIYITPVEG